VNAQRLLLQRNLSEPRLEFREVVRPVWLRAHVREYMSLVQTTEVPERASVDMIAA